MTLNPLAHVDWLGTVILPLIVSLSGAGFIGWGKPVNTNPHRLRWGLNGMALVALAGPASNVIFAVLLLGAGRAHLRSGELAVRQRRTARAPPLISDPTTGTAP